MVEIKTHEEISRRLCGTPVETRAGFSRVELVATKEMTVDEKGLVHGGFIFGLADYAAMIAVNHPNVVLASSNVKFLKPVKLEERAEATAVVQNTAEKKQVVSVTVKTDDTIVFAGEFICAILDHHVLDR